MLTLLVLSVLAAKIYSSGRVLFLNIIVIKYLKMSVHP